MTTYWFTQDPKLSFPIFMIPLPQYELQSYKIGFDESNDYFDIIGNPITSINKNDPNQLSVSIIFHNK